MVPELRNGTCDLGLKPGKSIQLGVLERSWLSGSTSLYLFHSKHTASSHDHLGR